MMLKNFSIKKLRRLGLSCGIIVIVFSSLSAQQLAFPGADGGGKFTRGGRGGKVIEVTNLNDTGPGSLRAAIAETGARTVVFRVSGTITLNSRLEIKNDSITIAGQTAPGGGICLRKYPLYVTANQVIVRYIRSRLGNESGGEDDAMTSLGSRKHIIIDHCSASWSIDETLSFYNNDSMTVQWCIVSESLYDSNHPKGSHGYGGIWGGRNSTFHHNLIAHHSSRTPRFSGEGTTVVAKNLDFRNNVIYNWGANSLYGGEAGTFNVVANYYKYGPATKNSVKYRIAEPYDAVARWYVTDNYVDGNPTITANNWSGGIQGGFASNASIKASDPFPFLFDTTHTPSQAYDLVLAHAGASKPNRDTVDKRIVFEAANRVALFDGKTYEIKNSLDTSVVRGIIDTQNDVGGWPELVQAVNLADADHDGMPDSWEVSRGLDPSNANDRNYVGAQGYTMLEVYLNGITDFPTAVNVQSEIPENFVLHQNYPNPFNPSTTIRYEIPSDGEISLKVFDLLGREISVIEKGWRNSGSYQSTFTASQELGSGVYFCQLVSNGSVKTIKLSLIR